MNIKNLKNKLEKSGLTDKEALIYVTILELGGAYPSKIAEITKINRSTVYKILIGLSIKGLVNEIEKSKKLFYQIENPRRLIRYVKDKVNMANDQLENAEKLAPDIEGLYSLFNNKPRVLFFEGQEDVLQIYADHLNVKKPYEMIAWANTIYLQDLLKNKFFLHYRKTKEKLGITTRGIVPDTEFDQEFVNNTYKKIGIAQKYWPKMKHVSDKVFSFTGEITIYDQDKVSIVNLNKNYFTGTIIQDKTIHDMMKLIFELSWKGADFYKK
jgi:HTH-type transcriptional regulator, sugar sensing transcriptional regulator